MLKIMELRPGVNVKFESRAEPPSPCGRCLWETKVPKKNMIEIKDIIKQLAKAISTSQPGKPPLHLFLL